MSPPGGPFVVFEGVEGAGKTTQASLLGAWLAQHGIAHTVAREPGGTEVGEAIRSVVLDRTELRVPPESELLLILAARAAFVKEIVRPALERGEVVIADRYDLSTLAYQGYGRGLDLDEVRRINTFASGGLRPDVYLVLDPPDGMGSERRRRRGAPPDRMEREGTGFHARVRGGYRELARSGERTRRVDAAGSPEEVHEVVLEVLRTEFPETFGDPEG